MISYIPPQGIVSSTLKSSEANGEKLELSQCEIIKNLQVKEGTELDEERPQQLPLKKQHPITT